MQQKTTPEEVLRILGDPRQIARDLQAFSRSAQVLSSNQNSLIKKYSRQWVAVHEGEVMAHADDFEALLALIDRKEIPRKYVIVRYIDSKVQTLIL